MLKFRSIPVSSIKRLQMMALARSTFSSASAEFAATLKNPSLLQTTAFINGEFVDAGQDTKTFDVLNPADGKVIARLPRQGEVATQTAIKAATVAFKSFKKTSARQRSKMLWKMHALVEENRDDLARIMTLEST